jgi:hypothetical protein
MAAIPAARTPGRGFGLHCIFPDDRALRYGTSVARAKCSSAGACPLKRRKGYLPAPADNCGAVPGVLVVDTAVLSVGRTTHAPGSITTADRRRMRLGYHERLRSMHSNLCHVRRRYVCMQPARQGRIRRRRARAQVGHGSGGDSLTLKCASANVERCQQRLNTYAHVRQHAGDGSSHRQAQLSRPNSASPSLQHVVAAG